MLALPLSYTLEAAATVDGNTCHDAGNGVRQFAAILEVEHVIVVYPPTTLWSAYFMYISASAEAVG